MLKRISVSQARVGMHLHKLEGDWLKHPFWKTAFVIDSPAQLARLQQSGVRECWIDNALGLDVAPPSEPDDDAATRMASSSASPQRVAPPPERARPQDEELRQAVAICDRGREAVQAMFSEARMGQTFDAERCMPLVEDITRSVQRNAGALVSLARLKRSDDYSYMHSVAVCAMMVALGRQLGMGDDECRAAGAAGLMHDIGKALMPIEILNKPGRLTEEEFAVMRGHPERGHALLAEGSGFDATTLDVVLHHHERIDGTGYPHGLAADAITRLARMGAVCDVYDAITSNRPYKAGWDPADSIARMASWKGHFDPAIFGAFVQCLGIYPTGSLVRLESQRLAVVVEQNPARLVAPVVKVFFSLRTQLHIVPRRIDLAQPGCSDRIVARESRTSQAAPGAPLVDRFPHLDELWADPELLRRQLRR